MIPPALLDEHRSEIATAAEPGFLRHDMAGVEMRRRHARIVHMGDERNSARPITRVGLRARNFLGELRFEFSVYGGNVHADLFEDTALHQRHGAAAAIRAVRHGALPILAYKAPRWLVRRPPVFVLDRLEGGTQPIAQRGEPARGQLLSRKGGGLGGSCAHVPSPPATNPPVCRNASPSAIAAAWATLSERQPARKGMRMRASAASCTRSVTPALSRPRRSVSPGAKPNAV